jgi:hypothetical protein
MTTKITADYEHNCETWWNAAREEAKGNQPSACVGLLDWTNEIICSDEDAAEFLAWAAKLPGWDESPFVVEVLDAAN